MIVYMRLSLTTPTHEMKPGVSRSPITTSRDRERSSVISSSERASSTVRLTAPGSASLADA